MNLFKANSSLSLPVQPTVSIVSFKKNVTCKVKKELTTDQKLARHLESLEKRRSTVARNRAAKIKASELLKAAVYQDAPVDINQVIDSNSKNMLYFDEIDDLLNLENAKESLENSLSIYDFFSDIDEELTPSLFPDFENENYYSSFGNISDLAKITDEILSDLVFDHYQLLRNCNSLPPSPVNLLSDCLSPEKIFNSFPNTEACLEDTTTTTSCFRRCFDKC